MPYVDRQLLQSANQELTNDGKCLASLPRPLQQDNTLLISWSVHLQSFIESFRWSRYPKILLSAWKIWPCGRSKFSSFLIRLRITTFRSCYDETEILHKSQHVNVKQVRKRRAINLEQTDRLDWRRFQHTAPLRYSMRCWTLRWNISGVMRRIYLKHVCLKEQSICWRVAIKCPEISRPGVINNPTCAPPANWSPCSRRWPRFWMAPSTIKGKGSIKGWNDNPRGAVTRPEQAKVTPRNPALWFHLTPNVWFTETWTSKPEGMAG